MNGPKAMSALSPFDSGLVPINGRRSASFITSSARFAARGESCKLLMLSHPRHFLLGGLRRTEVLSPASAGLLWRRTSPRPSEFLGKPVFPLCAHAHPAMLSFLCTCGSSTEKPCCWTRRASPELPALQASFIQINDMAAYRDAAWVVKRHSLTVLPSVASLKALRVFAEINPASIIHRSKA
jgi:hypothetical protein